MSITKVWIEEGCIVCNACEAECPDVFHVTADSCHIKSDSRVDGQEDENRSSKSALQAALQSSLENSIIAAAVACPVNVIQYEQVASEVPVESPKVETVAEVPAPVVPMAVSEPAPSALASPLPEASALTPKPRITEVWIDEGCIVCNACEAECPEVFHVTADSCHIKADVRLDGKENENRAEKSKIKDALGESLIEKIIAAAAGCPVDVIKYGVFGDAPKIEKKVDAVHGHSPEASQSFVWNIAAAPNRLVVMPKTVPLPSLKIYLAEQEAQKVADEAKWQKQLADYETNKAKAIAEGKEAPKAPVRAAAKKDDNDVIAPTPSSAEAPELIYLQQKLGSKVEEIFQQSGELVCQVRPDSILEALALCKDDPALKFEMLADETATHYPAADQFKFSIVYHLTSLSRQRRLRLRILIPEGYEVASAVAVYPGANWLEREIFDMLGIRFTNHPDLTRILCPEDWEGFPLRKEYPTLGLGQREIDFREDRSGVLMRLSLEKAGNLSINLKKPEAN